MRQELETILFDRMSDPKYRNLCPVFENEREEIAKDLALQIEKFLSNKKQK